MKIDFSFHARERCFQRDISDLDVEKVIKEKKVDRILQVVGETIVRANIKGRVLNIVVAGTIAGVSVITVY